MAIFRPRVAATCDAFDAFGVDGASKLALWSGPGLERADDSTALSSVESGLS